MTLRSAATAAAFAALLAAQLLPAATLAWRQTERLHAGRPLLLTVETRDPRDLFRGEYSVLAYAIGRLQGVPAAAGSACDLAARETCALGAERAVYVRLAPDAEGVHRATEVAFERPPGDGPFIAGTVRSGTLVRNGTRFGQHTCEQPACLFGQARYGIETWYGAQGVPARLDRMARRDIRVEVRVDADGIAVLDGLRVGGEPFAKTARLWR